MTDIRILILSENQEDDEQVRSVFHSLQSHQNQLSTQGITDCDIQSAFDEPSAISMVSTAERNNRQYDIIFIDVHLPNSTETIRNVLSINANIELIINGSLTESQWNAVMDSLSSAPNIVILEKPFLAPTFKQIARSTIQKILLRHTIHSHQNQIHDTVKEKTDSLLHSITILYSILNATDDAILVFDKMGGLVKHNDASQITFNLPAEHIIQGDTNPTFSEIIKPLSQRFEAVLHDFDLLAKSSTDKVFGTITFDHGEIYEYHAATQQNTQTDIHQIWCFRDVTELKRKEAAMQHQAYHDPLTDLPNRLLLLDRIGLAIAQHQSEGTLFGILFIDLDYFKKVNDSAGHKVGDALLQSASNRIKKCIRQRDTLARIGGDEFIVVINGVNSHSMASKYARDIIARLEENFIFDDKPFRISCSVGISMYPQDAKDAEELIRKADLAMFDAKAKGRGKYTFFSPPLEHLAMHHYNIESQLRGAIEDSNLSLHYQPVLDAQTLKITKIEALIRWQLENGDTIYPDQFIGIAEKTDLIKHLGFWVIKQACQQISSWQKQGLSGFRVAINFSPNQFSDRTLITSLLNTMSRYGISGESLEIEITETALIENIDAVKEMLAQLQQNNITIAIDDFGTGYSSMSYLRSLPIDNIKIDRTFIGNLHESEESRTIVNAVISLAHNLKLKVAAEGVENEITADLLRSENCDYLQGYHYFKPILAETLTPHLQQSQSHDTQSKEA